MTAVEVRCCRRSTPAKTNRRLLAMRDSSHFRTGGTSQSVSATDRLYLASRVPTLLVWGDADTLIPVAHAHAAHAAIPGSRLAIFEGAGHFPHCDAPERFAEALVDFCDTTDPVSLGDENWHDLLRGRADPPEPAGGCL